MKIEDMQIEYKSKQYAIVDFLASFADMAFLNETVEKGRKRLRNPVKIAEEARLKTVCIKTTILNNKSDWKTEGLMVE